MPKRKQSESPAPVAQPKRRPGRPKKGMVRLLVSLDPATAGLLRLTAYFLAAFEQRPFDYSELLRDILDKSPEWQRMYTAVSGGVTAILRAPGATDKLAEVMSEGDRDAPGGYAKGPDGKFAARQVTALLQNDPGALRSDALAAAMREALLLALKPENTRALDFEQSRDLTDLVMLLQQRAGERREKEKKRVLDEAAKKFDADNPPAAATPKKPRSKKS